MAAFGGAVSLCATVGGVHVAHVMPLKVARAERAHHEAINAASDAELFGYDINEGWPV